MAKKTTAPTNPHEGPIGLPQVSVEIPYVIANSKLFVREITALGQDMATLVSRIHDLERRLQIHRLNLTDSRHASIVGELAETVHDWGCDAARSDRLTMLNANLRVFCASSLGSEAFDKIDV